MSRTNLTASQKTILQKLWDEGMITGKRKDLIGKAVEKTGLDETTIMNWIGNNKRKMGMAVKRGSRKNENKIHSSGYVRKRSAYSAFKKEFLASNKAKKMREDGVAESEIQKQGSLEYRQLSPNSMAAARLRPGCGRQENVSW
ncbi:uncharacterized protein LOC114542657 isoform X2 [Dendronephthya gigantea]|uniref:uncharacterized protein LOC114542657 isoform X2 n=1 Tax=Dendronephthya gigantea TaxID=151771 RepID=UPI001069E086|nr:uncharacterized protein LOC114542657 isoform X2 [Dendronephthya gigantea]XP_028417957.1 uncharacterized protein LOC114542657 isoform X2 [Dendronephthya gigantea]